jgi:uncharacterized protein YybS (DUF2232 family)
VPPLTKKDKDAMNTFSARPMIESALLAAISVVLVLIGFYVPVIGMVATLVAPLPSAMAVIRHGVRWGILSSIVTVLALSPFLGWITAASLWTVFGLSGIAFGWAVKRKYSPSMVVAITSIAALVGILAGILEAYIVAGITPTQMVEQMVEGFRLSLELNERIMGQDPMAEQMLKTLTDVSTIIRIFPAALIMASIFQSYVNYQVARWVLPKLGQPIEPLPPFSRWMFPNIVAHSWLFAAIATLLQVVRQNDLLLRAAETIFHAGSFLLVIQAFSLVTFYLMRAGFPRLMIGFALYFLYSLSVTSGLGVFFALSGMIDILFDFRHIRTDQELV